MTSAPWAEPELIVPRPAADARRPARRPPAAGRVVAVPAAPRARTTAPGADWGEIEVPGCWTMQDTWDRPHYTNVQMPFPDRPPEVPEENPTGVYERAFEVPAAGPAGGSSSTSAPRRAC